jgi:N-acetylglucosaminyldiphosphoundecaprenol N-acetyl-beta-D-mannosaminyltransferase
MDQETEKFRRRIISLNIDLIKYNDSLTQIIEKGKAKTPAYVCFANVHMIIEAYGNRNFAEQVNGATLVLPDGMPVVNALQFLYGISQERIPGMNAFPDLIRMSEVNDLKIFLFGTTDTLLEQIRVKAERQFPKLKIAGLFSPPFDKSIDEESYITLINDSGANLVFVALGCPKQEKWMATHSHKIQATLVGVGGAFPVYAGTVKRAPEWVQSISLEWLYRLSQEPVRLFKRYLRTNTLFLVLISRIKWGQLFHKPRKI